MPPRCSSRSRRSPADAPPPVTAEQLSGWFGAALPDGWFACPARVRHDADEILVLERGAIVERGRHDDLLEEGGLYAHLHAMQAGRPPA